MQIFKTFSHLLSVDGHFVFKKNQYLKSKVNQAKVKMSFKKIKVFSFSVGF